MGGGGVYEKILILEMGDTRQTESVILDFGEKKEKMKRCEKRKNRREQDWRWRWERDRESWKGALRGLNLLYIEEEH